LCFSNGIAKALGYKTYVDMSMETKMAGSMENVVSILDQLLEKGKMIDNVKSRLKIEVSVDLLWNSPNLFPIDFSETGASVRN